MNATLFFYIFVAASLIMAGVWFFIIEPMERRNHENKLEILQQKIKNHEEQLRAGKDVLPEQGAEDSAAD